MPSLDDYCSACEQPLPTERHKEFLKTPLGDCYVRTHNTQACIQRARELREGVPFDPDPTSDQRAKAKLKMLAQAELPMREHGD